MILRPSSPQSASDMATPTHGTSAPHLVHSTKPVVPRDRLLRLPEVEAMTGCKKSTIYRLMKEGKFPACRRITARMACWSEAAVLQWVQDRLNGVGV